LDLAARKKTDQEVAEAEKRRENLLLLLLQEGVF